MCLLLDAARELQLQADCGVCCLQSLSPVLGGQMRDGEVTDTYRGFSLLHPVVYCVRNIIEPPAFSPYVKKVALVPVSREGSASV